MNIRNSSIHDFQNTDKNNKETPNLFNTPNPDPVIDFQELDEMIGEPIDPSTIQPDCLKNMNDDAVNYRQAMFRDEHIYKLLSILTAKDKSNALIVGEAGVGKTNIVEELVRWLTIAPNPVATHLLNGFKICELPITSMIAGNKYVGDLEQTIDRVIAYASNPENKVILFIDEIHQLLSNNSSSEGKITQTLKTALGRGKIRAIGATTTQEASVFLKDPAFTRRWTKMIVPELTKMQTYEVLKNNKERYEQFHNVLIPDELLEKIISISDEFKPYGSHRPDSALTLLDRALSEEKIEFQRKKHSDDEMLRLIAQEIELKTTYPVLSEKRLKTTAMSLISVKNTNFINIINEMEETFKRNIIGQEKVKEQVLNMTKRLSLNMIPSNKPRSFIFAGPSGTGKTEIAKQMAKSLFGNKKDFIYLNMTEYTEPSTMTKLIGATDGYVGSDSKRELPLDSLESKPFQIVLLDEFEKAHPDIQRLFMQALDEGSITTNRNTVIDFSRAIIIATTNAGLNELSEKTIGFGAPEKKTFTSKQSVDILSRYFPIELLNRFQHIVFFDSISKQEYAQILAVKYNQLVKSIHENRSSVQIEPQSLDIDQLPTDERFEQLVNDTYDPLLNGRPAERTMQQYIEDEMLRQGLQQTYQLFNV